MEEQHAKYPKYMQDTKNSTGGLKKSTYCRIIVHIETYKFIQFWMVSD